MRKIDELLSGADASPLAAGSPDREAVGIVQDLLTVHGHTGLPGVRSQAYGIFGPRTQRRVREFQHSCGLRESGAVDRATLVKMIDSPAKSPQASRGYLSLVLDYAFTGMVRLVSLTSQFEALGLFGAINRNTDRAGLSFGLIQWAQKPGRLNELLLALHTEQPDRFIEIFGGGDVSIAQGLIAHTAKQDGGVDSSGHTADMSFDLIAEPWLGRFRNAALDRHFQRVQVNVAIAAFESSIQRLKTDAPEIRSERAVAFMLDLANQHGDGGARSIYRAATQSVAGDTSEALLLALGQESVRRVRAQFGDGTETVSTLYRREAFRTSPLLSDQEFLV